jgi:hypothetical protein
VRVGRAPIDETAIRLLEQHNPDVEFDWTRILKAPPAGEGQGRRDVRDMRDRDQRGRREPRSAQRPRSGPPSSQFPPRPRSVDGRPQAVEPVRRADSLSQAAEHPAQAADHADYAELPARAADHADYADHQARAADHAEHADHQAQAAELEDYQAQAPDHAEHADYQAQAADHVEHPDSADRAESQTRAGDYAATPAETVDLINEMLEAPEVPDVRSDDVGSASYVRLGAEGLVRLRGRYAEVMARIAEQPLEEAAREELKLRAERLNPDAWVTADEVTAALEQYETVFEGLRGIVGRHPRRRQRGRR